MSGIGHVYPALFYLGVGFLLAARTRQAMANGQPLDLILNGGSYFLLRWGMLVMLVTTIGICVEGIGGALTFNNLFFQMAHQMIHLGFFFSGLSCVLEGMHVLPFDTWRMGVALGFVIQALVFYGHQLEQEVPESGLHLCIVGFSLLTASAFGLSVCTRSLVMHLVGTAGVILHGIWLLWIAEVIYTGHFGHHGMMLMPADIYVSAGGSMLLMAIIMVALFGRFGKGSSTDPDSSFSFADQLQPSYAQLDTKLPPDV